MVQMNSVKMVYDSSGTEALHGVDLDIHDGEFVFLVGPSGSGKTTIIKLLTGEVHASSGEITVNGFDMMRIKRRKLPFLRRTIRISIDFRLIDKMTVYDNVAFAMRVVGAGNAAIKERVPYVLELVGLKGTRKAFSAGALRRRAAACGHSPRARELPAHDNRGRAHRQPRPRTQPGAHAPAREDKRARHDAARRHA